MGEHETGSEDWRGVPDSLVALDGRGTKEGLREAERLLVHSGLKEKGGPSMRMVPSWMGSFEQRVDRFWVEGEKWGA